MAKDAIPIPQTKSEELLGLQVDHLGFIDMFMQADIVVKSVIILLLLASIWSWGIIFSKYSRFNMIRHKTHKFEEKFWSGDMLEHLYDRVKNHADTPMTQMFIAAMNEWMGQNVRRAVSKDSSLKVGLKERLSQSMIVARNRAIERMENGLSFLATVGSTAPFVGLFGTVWGIMNSFQSIAAAKNTSLAVVAPGIAEALFATAIGLFAAIPAVMFYNKFTNELGAYVTKLDDFSSEFLSILSRELDEQDARAHQAPPPPRYSGPPDRV